MQLSNNKPSKLRLSLLWRILLATLLAGIVPLALSSYLALQGSKDNNKEAIEAATAALDTNAVRRLQLLARDGSQAITNLLEETVQETLSASLLARNSQTYLNFYQNRYTDIYYAIGSDKAPGKLTETIARYRELVYIDASGQEKVRISNGEVIPQQALRNVSDPANTTYKTETYWAETRDLPRGEVWVSHLTAWHTSLKEQPASLLDASQTALGANYGNYEGVYRFTTPVFNEQGQFDGLVMLALDARVLMELVIHIVPTEEVRTISWPEYSRGSYGLVWDADGYLVVHPFLKRLRSFGADGKVLPDQTDAMTAQERDVAMFRFQNTRDNRAKMYNDSVAGKDGVTSFVSEAQKVRSNAYTPIRFARGVYKEKGLFGGLAVGANNEDFSASAQATSLKLQKAQDEFSTNLLLVAIGSVGLLVVVAALLSSSIIRPVTRLTRVMRRVQRGEDIDTRLEDLLRRRVQDEVTSMSQVFQQMINTVHERERELKISNEKLEEYNANLESQVTARTEQLAQANSEITALNNALKAENVRLSAEVEVTRQLQQMILPKDQELKAVDGLDIASFMASADEVGGDYYDVLNENGRIKIGIGDVTGHGLESGVLMLMVQTAVRTLLVSNVTDSTVFLSILNRVIYENLQRMKSDKNLTLSLLDYADGHLRLSGQHEEMIVVRKDGSIERVDTMDLGFPIGLEEDISDFVAQRDVLLYEDDVVILYTDGIPEAANEQGQQYGMERLCEIVLVSHHKNAKEIKTAVIDDLLGFIGQQKVYDDITLLVLKQKQVLAPLDPEQFKITSKPFEILAV